MQAVRLENLVQVQALLQPAATARPMWRRTIGLASSGLEEGLAAGMFLSHRALDLRLSRVRTGVAVMGQDCN